MCSCLSAPWFFRFDAGGFRLSPTTCRHIGCRLEALGGIALSTRRSPEIHWNDTQHMWAITRPTVHLEIGVGMGNWSIHLLPLHVLFVLRVFAINCSTHYDDWISWHFNKWWIACCHTFTGKNQTFSLFDLRFFFFVLSSHSSVLHSMHSINYPSIRVFSLPTYCYIFNLFFSQNRAGQTAARERRHKIHLQIKDGDSDWWRTSNFAENKM